MKKFLSISTLCLFFLTQPLFGQESKTQSLFNGSGKVKPGVYLSAGAYYTPINSADAASLSFSAGALLNKKFQLGGFYDFTVNEFSPAKIPSNQFYTDVKLGGLQFFYHLNPDNVIHLSFGANLGAGEISHDWKDAFEAGETSNPFGEEYFGFIEPQILGELNLTRNIRLYGGLGYRITTGFNYQGINAEDIQGLTIRLGLRGTSY